MRENAGPSASDTCQLLMSELTAAPEPGAPPEAEWRPGEILLGEFEIERRLGAGGFGSVTLVKSALTLRHYAMKTIKPELIARPRSRRTFALELASWIDLGAHPRVVRAHFVRQIGATAAVFMEHVTGGTLAEWIARGLLLDVEAISRVAGEIAAGLDVAHARGLVHADVKPENVLMSADGAKVSDFGLAVAAGGSAGGMTVAYRSPEQAGRVPLTPATDVWSFGLTVLAMFAGGPFWADGQVARAALQDFLDDPPPDRPLLPSPAGAALRRCFAARREHRWASVVEAAHALFGSAATPAVEAHRAPAATAEETAEERPIERWLPQAFALAGVGEARAHLPPRRGSREAQAIADLDALEAAAPLLAPHLAPEHLSELHEHWSGALWGIGDVRAALEHAGESVAALERAEAPDPLVLSARLRDLAYCALNASQRAVAESALLQAREALASIRHGVTPERAREILDALGQTFADIAQMLRLTLRFDQALAWAEDAVKCCESAVSTGFDGPLARYHLARAHAEKATALKWLGRSAEAVESFRTAFDLFIASGHSHAALEQRVFYANALRDAGRLDDSMAEVESAIAELSVTAPDAESLFAAYSARAELLVRKGNWQEALADFERKRGHFERLVHDRGRRAMSRVLAEAEIHHARALDMVGRHEEALPLAERTVAFLERLKRAGDWGPLDNELSDARVLASGCELSHLKAGVEAHGSFPSTRLHAAADHAVAAADHADAHRRRQPSAEAALRAARSAAGAAGLLDMAGRRDAARRTRARALEALEALEAMPDGPSAERAALRAELSAQEREADLSAAFAALLKGDGEGALAAASRWSDAWISRCIQFCARAYFLHEEPAQAAKAFGSLDGLRQLARSDRVEGHLVRGLGALFLRDHDRAIAALRAAADLAPRDPYVAFALAYTCARSGAPPGEQEAARARFAANVTLHPLLHTVEIELGWSGWSPHAPGA